MKINLLLALYVIFTSSLNAQKENNILNTDPKNDFSLYLKKSIDQSLLQETNYTNKSQTIKATFSLNKSNEIYNFKTNNSNHKLDIALLDAFCNYPLEKLVGKNPKQNILYRYLVIDKKRGKNRFNCSNSVSTRTTALISKCKNYNQYPDQRKCFSNELKNHFSCTVNPSVLPDTKKTIRIKYKVSKSGKLSIKTDSKSKSYNKEIDRVFSLFDQHIKASTIDGVKATSVGQFIINLTNQSDTECEINLFNEPEKRNNEYNPLAEQLKKMFTKNSQPITNNKLSYYFKEHLDPQTLGKTNLNDINDQLIAYFNINSKGEYTNVRTNSRSKTVSNNICNLLKKYPVSELNLPQTALKSDTFSIQILSFENNETIIKTSSKVTTERMPVYRGCEQSENYKDLRSCLSQKINTHINNHFKISKAAKLELSPGRKRIFCMFRINTAGRIEDIQVRAPHPDLSYEARRVLYLIPNMKHSALQSSKPVAVKYSLPISFMIKPRRIKRRSL